MSEVNSEAQTITMSDGYVMEYNIYYDDASGQVPLLFFFHGAGGNRSSAVDSAKTARDNGFTCVTLDHRGHGDGGGSDGDDWIGDNGYTNSEYGWGLYCQRDMQDIVELMHYVNANYSSYIEFSKIGLSGTSAGGALTWLMSGLGEDRTLIGGMPMPKISAISPRAFLPRRQDAITAPARDLIGERTPTFCGYIWDGYKDQTAIKTHLATNLQLLQDTLDTGDAYQLKSVITGRTASSDNRDTLLNRYPNVDELGERLPRDFPILAILDCDDHWAPPNALIDLLSHRENAFGVFGASGGHAATEVDGEEIRMRAKQLHFFRYYLKNEDVLATNFGNSSPTACPKVEMLITPNNATDYADEDPPPYTDTSYSWVRVTAEKMHWLRRFGDEDATAVTSIPTQLWIGETALVAAEPSGSDWTTTITNTWGTATTPEDVSTAIAGGVSSTNIDSYYSSRITYDTNDFQKVITASTSPLKESTYLGVAQGHFWLSASQAGAQVYAKTQYSADTGANWIDVADTWYAFPESYVAGDIRKVCLEFSLKAMHLPGGGSTNLLRVQFANYTRFDVPQVNGDNPVRCHPCFDNNTVTLYHGETYPSRIVLPLHPDTVTVFEP